MELRTDENARPLSQRLTAARLRTRYVVRQSVECQCQLAAINLQGRPALRLHICPPLPDKVDRAHSVAFIWDGRSYRGVVRDQGKCGDGGLNLLLELQ